MASEYNHDDQHNHDGEYEHDNERISRSASPDSLFDASSSSSSAPPPVIAERTAPPIPGLYFEPTLLLPSSLCSTLFTQCTHTFFAHGADQAMLFGARMLPPFLSSLLSTLSTLLRPALPPHIHALIFDGPPARRQAIVNAYAPGAGIAPHVDLPGRYGDGVLGVSLGGACAMNFTCGADAHALLLPPRSVLVLTGAARYAWTHGIAARRADAVRGADGEVQVVEREPRVSVTFRWLLPDAMVVGGP
jgi:hypothetical protein